MEKLTWRQAISWHVRRRHLEARAPRVLLELNRVEGTTLVLVTHDPALAAHADRIVTLRDGVVVTDVASGNVRSEPFPADAPWKS